MKITDSSITLSSNTEMQKSHIVKENISLYENADKQSAERGYAFYL